MLQQFLKHLSTHNDWLPIRLCTGSTRLALRCQVGTGNFLGSVLCLQDAGSYRSVFLCYVCEKVRLFDCKGEDKGSQGNLLISNGILIYKDIGGKQAVIQQILNFSALIRKDTPENKNCDLGQLRGDAVTPGLAFR